jgi:hypothetical protein
MMLLFGKTLLWPLAPLSPRRGRDYAYQRETTGVRTREEHFMHSPRPHAFALREKKAGPSLRLGLIARVRREIEMGVYDTPEKLEIALGRLLESVAEHDNPEQSPQ